MVGQIGFDGTGKDQINKFVRLVRMNTKFCLIKTMFNSQEEANSITRQLLNKHLIVSGQIKKDIHSIYFWDNKIQSDKEIELTYFTEIRLKEEVFAYIKSKHSYDVCELICIPIIDISEEFATWISDYIK